MRWHPRAHATKTKGTTSRSWTRPAPASFLEAAEPSQLGEEGHPQAGDRERADAAQEHGGHGAEKGGRDSGFEGPELIGGAREEGVHGADAPAHGIRRPDLGER